MKHGIFIVKFSSSKKLMLITVIYVFKFYISKKMLIYIEVSVLEAFFTILIHLYLEHNNIISCKINHNNIEIIVKIKVTIWLKTVWVNLTVFMPDYYLVIHIILFFK